MKRVLFPVLFFLFISTGSDAFDRLGLQPVAPNGVFSTFGAESLSKGRISFELGMERSREPDFYRFSLKGAYGISDSVEFNIMIPYVYHFSDVLNDMEDVSVGIKHRFYNEGKYGPSLAYLVNASINNGGDDFSTNGRLGIGFIMSKRVGPFKGHMNIFYEKPGTGRLQDEITFSGGIEFAAAHNFKLLGEVIAKKGHYSNEYDLMEARFGYRIKTTDYIYTTLGAGLDLKDRSPEYRVILSVGFTFPQEKKEIRKILEEE